MTIHVVVPVHNRIELTEQFLDSVDHQQTSQEVSVLLVDDGSADGTHDVVSKRVGRYATTVLTGTGSWWWAGSVRRALAYLSPKVKQQDFVYLGNNDTVLHSRHFEYLHDTASRYPKSLVGACSWEVWPDGSAHLVPGGFSIDINQLTVRVASGAVHVDQEFDALAGRGLLIPAEALPHVTFHERLMPQHFADITMTQGLRRKGFSLRVDPRATSRQIDRAGSAVEVNQTVLPSLDKKSALYLPALASFWWHVSPPAQRPRALFAGAGRALKVLRGNR